MKFLPKSVSKICVLDSIQVVDSETASCAKLLEQETSVSELMLLFDGLPA